MPTQEAKDIRIEVFQKEQGFQQEFDEIDNYALSFLGSIDGKTVATLRLFRDKENSNRFTIGRVAVRKEYRGRGLGQELIKEALKVAKEEGATAVYLHSQITAMGFYESCGFEGFGEIGLDEGCPHRWMVKYLSSKNL